MNEKSNKKQRSKEYILALSFLISVPIVNVSYWLLDNSDRGVYSLVTSIDRSIPFVPAFVLPYVLWYPFIIITLAYLCYADRIAYFKTLISFDLGLIACYTIYFFFQTTVPRPVVMGNGFFPALLRFVYSSDKPYNCFPSIHVLTCYLMIKGVKWSKVRKKIVLPVVSASAVLIILSTLFIRQHVFLDILSGVFLGDLIFSFVYYYLWDGIALHVRQKWYRLGYKKKIRLDSINK